MHTSGSFAQDGMYRAYLGCMLVSAIHEDLCMAEPWWLSPMPKETATRFLRLCLTLSVSSQLIVPAAVGLRYALLPPVSVLFSRCPSLFLLRYVAAGCCCTINYIEHGMQTPCALQLSICMLLFAPHSILHARSSTLYFPRLLSF